MKKQRKEILEKYNNRCAYCGVELTNETMQIDHIDPTKHNKQKNNNIENLNPSCQFCNHYKRDYSLEEFRHLLKTIYKRLYANYLFRFSVNFGLVKFTEWDGKFFYEKHNQNGYN